MLGIIISAYRDFEERIEIVTVKASSLEMVRKAIASIVGKFTKADIIKLCPSIGVKTIEKHLKTLLDLNEIRKHGSARATFYTKNI